MTTEHKDSAGYGALLRNRGFMALMATVFLGAITDNIFRIIVALFATRLAADAGDSTSLALGSALFVVPYLLFSGYAGYIADRFDKRRVLIIVKSMEILAMALGYWALMAGRMDMMLAVIFLTALQSALFAPAHYGILPEILPESAISRANGLDQLCTFIAIVIGSAAGGAMSDAWGNDMPWIGGMLMAIAVIGSLTSLWISQGAAPVSHRPFPKRPWGEMVTGIRRLYRVRPLWLTVLGISYFWFLGALLQLGNMLMGEQILGLSDTEIGLMNVAVAIGIAFGSIAAGRLSGDHVEFGLVPLGSIGIGVGALMLAAAPPSYTMTLIALAVIGFSAGLFIVPLNAFLQLRAGADERGRLIAANNFLNMFGVMLAAGVLWLLSNGLNLAADEIVLVIGLTTFAATVYVLIQLGDFFVRFLLWLLTHSIYRITVAGAENMPRRGPALLVSNHVSFVDGLLIGATVPRFVRFIMYRAYYDLPVLNWLFRAMHAIPISGGNPKLINEAFARAREALKQGHVVCIFAEGALSRSGNLLPFRRGVERILEDIDVPVIPVHLDRVWGSIFSFKDGKFFWKWPRRVPLPVTVSFGKAMTSTASAWEMRQAILELGSDAFVSRRRRDDLLASAFPAHGPALLADRCPAGFHREQSDIRQGARGIAGPVAAVSPRPPRGTDGGRAVAGLDRRGAGECRAVLRRQGAGKSELHPGRCGNERRHRAMRHQGHHHLAALSREGEDRAAGRHGLHRGHRRADLQAGEVPAGAGRLSAAGAAAGRALRPTAAIARGSGHRAVLQRQHRHAQGSRAVASCDPVECRGRRPGAVGGAGRQGAGHPAVLPRLRRDRHAVAAADRRHRRGLSRQSAGCEDHRQAGEGPPGDDPDRHADLLPILSPGDRGRSIPQPAPCGGGRREAAAETGRGVPGEIRHRPAGRLWLHGDGAGGGGERAGYGRWRHAPCGPQARHRGASDPRRGRAHRRPGNAEPRWSPGEAGLLLVKGGGRMTGYLNDPARTADALADGWYITGDIAVIDEDGFIRITDRLARFSKIGGEMVPHGRIEEAAAATPGITRAVVVAVADAARGEKLVLLYTGEDGVAPEDLWNGLSQAELPNLWIPKRQQIHRVPELPVLATGKIDLQATRRLALELSQKVEA